MKKWKIIAGALLMAPLGSSAAAQPAAPDPSGDWRGSIAVGDTRQRIALHLGPKSTFDMPERNALGVPVEMKAQGAHVVVTINGAGLFEGDLAPDGQSLNGVMKGGPSDIPIHFERGVFAAANRPQTPQPPFPYRAEEVGFDNPRQAGVHLAGTLTTPPGKGPFPAVFLITGSGAQDRDETIFEHKPFLTLGDALTRRGIAVLRIDDRGIGGSSAGPPNATTADFVTDAQTAVAWLKTRGDIDPKRIGLLGHSEGGIIAPIVASHDPSIAFAVLWASPGIRGRETVVEQVRAIALASGVPAEQAQRSAAMQATILDAVIAASDFAAARTAITAITTSNGAPPIIDATVSQLMSPWYRYFLSLDPAAAMRKVKVPVLALLGGKDTQIPAELNEPTLRSALAGNRQASVETLPGLNHLFQTATTGSPQEYASIEETISPLALNRMVDWIVMQAGK